MEQILELKRQHNEDRAEEGTARILTCSGDGSIKVFDLSSKRCTKTADKLHGGKQILSLLQMTENAVLTAGGDGLIFLWSLPDFALQKTFAGHTQKITQLRQISPSLFLSGSDDCSIRLWSVKLGRCCRIWSLHKHTLTSIALVTSQIFVSGGWDEFLVVWKVSQQRCLKKITYTKDRCVALLALSCSHVLVSMNTFCVHKINIQSGQTLQSFKFQSQINQMITLKENRNLIALILSEGKVKIIDQKNEMREVNAYNFGYFLKLQSITQLRCGRLVTGMGNGAVSLIF